MTNLAEILIASQTINDSSVVGASVKDALNTLLAASSATPFYGTYANRPAAGTAGRIAFITDSPISTWIDDGTAWRPLLNDVLGIQTPAIAGFTTFNIGAATFADASGSLSITGVNDGAPPGALRGATIANAANTAYAELAVRLRTVGDTTANHFYSANVLLRETGTAKAYALVVFLDCNNHRVDLQLETWTNNTTRASATNKGAAVLDGNGPLFLRVRRDATNLFAEVSRSRETWTQLDTRSIASTFTTAPDAAGFACNGINMVPTFSIVHFTQGS